MASVSINCNLVAFPTTNQTKRIFDRIKDRQVMTVHNITDAQILILNARLQMYQLFTNKKYFFGAYAKHTWRMECQEPVIEKAK